MVVYISGQAGRAVIPQGNNLRVMDVETGSTFVFPAAHFSTLFLGANDVSAYPLYKDDAIIKQLHLERNKDRALVMALMVLDKYEENELRRDASEILSDLFEDDLVYSFVENKLYSRPLLDMADISGALDFSKQQKKIYDFISKLNDRQEQILICYNSLRSALSSKVRDEADRHIFAQEVCNSGIFKSAVIALSDFDCTAMNSCKLESWKNPNIIRIIGYRDVVSAWLNPITPDRHSKKNSTLFSRMMREQSQDNEICAIDRSPTNVHAAYQQAKSQVSEIKSLLQKLKIPQARKFTNELIRAQIDSNSAEYAAKSLCNIASYAASINQKEFALELDLQAVELAPTDGLAWCALADAHISLGQYDAANQALIAASERGHSVYADNGRMRILRHLDRTEEAISEYLQLIVKHKDALDAWRLYVGLAETYKSINDYDSAYSFLLKAISIAPQEYRPVYALGNVYKDTGQFSLAIETYKRACTLPEAGVECYLGVGYVFKEMGSYNKALKEFQIAKSSFLNESDPNREIGEILRLLGKPRDALAVYAQMKTEFPYDISSYSESAFAYADLGQPSKGEKEFIVALENPELETDAGFRVKYAKFLKSIGDSKRALQMYSKIRSEFPNYMPAKLGQADMLKELGDLTNAINYYSDITDQKNNLSVSISMAAIHLSLNNFYDAQSLLPNKQPLTKIDWVAEHIKGMLLLKSGKIQEAITLFQKGLEIVPFASQKTFFKNALALAYLKSRKFDDILDIVESTEDREPICNIIKLHAYCALNARKKAELVYDSICQNNSYDLSNVVFLTKELGAHFGLNDEQPKHNGTWIHEQECNLLAISATAQKAA